MEPKVKRTKTPEQALAQLMRLCARAEKSSGDALRLMRSWGVEEREQAGLLRTLKAQKFIDESRYAAAFVREKFRLNGWGAYKIRTALARKGIPQPTIEEALSQIAPDATAERLRIQLERRIKSIRSTTAYELRGKLMRYGLSLGYAYDTVADTVGQLVKNTEECNDF